MAILKEFTEKKDLYPINQSILVHKIWEHESMNCNRA